MTSQLTPWAKDYVCGAEALRCFNGCNDDDLSGPCNVGGVAIATWCRLYAEIPAPENGDHWSMVMRPGAWEYFTEEGQAMRRALHRAGYVEELDGPNRPMGTRWVRHRLLMGRDPIIEILASPAIGPPIGATLYCPNFGQGCRWRTRVDHGLLALERQATHIMRCKNLEA